jgi:tetratricopeptide (TPR) repeat protein
VPWLQAVLDNRPENVSTADLDGEVAGRMVRGRVEESGTLGVLLYYVAVLRLRDLGPVPPDQRQETASHLVGFCARAAQIARYLGDEACAAFFDFSAALAHTACQDFDEAEPLLLAARTVYQRYTADSPPAAREVRSQIANGLGSIAMWRNQPQKARDFFREALVETDGIAVPADDDGSFWATQVRENALYNLGNLIVRLGDAPEEAEAHLSESLELTRRRISQAPEERRPFRQILAAETLISLGLVRLKQRRGEAALRDLGDAHALLERLQAEVPEEMLAPARNRLQPIIDLINAAAGGGEVAG